MDARELAEKDRVAREWCADPHRYFKAFSRTARRFQQSHPSPRYRVMTLVGGPQDFLPRRPILLNIFGHTMPVDNWAEVFAYIAGEVVASCPSIVIALERAGMLPWMANLAPAGTGIVEAFRTGQASLTFATLEEGFNSILWLLAMADVKFNEVLVQVDPYASEADWRARESAMRAKREEENRVLREIDEARRRYAEAHPEEAAAQNAAAARSENKEDMTWEI